MFKLKLAAIVSEAIFLADAAGQIGSITFDLLSLPISIERPRLAAHGDLSCTVAMQLAAQPDSMLTAMELAQILVSHIETRPEDGYFTYVKAVAPGFINFGLGPRIAGEILVEIGRLAGEYGCISSKETTGSLSCHLPRLPLRHSLKLVRGTTSIESQADPAFCLQYAYARCCAILRQATEPRVNILTGQLEEPLMSMEQWGSFLLDCKSKVDIYMDLETESFSDTPYAQTDLILKLASFPEEVATAAHFQEPERLGQYVLDLANELAVFCRRFNLGQGMFYAQLSVLKARLGLIFATKQVLSNALGIIGMSAPEHMPDRL